MTINVLVVIDGDFQFDTNPPVPDFTFKTLVSTLKNAGFQVTLASRENVTDGSGAIPNFNFATSVNLLDFDVIWMLGDGGFNDAGDIQEGKGPLDTTNQQPNTVPAEKNAIANFMEQGGGVFAVGDHFDLGSDMCGLLPRVRIMRSWFADYNPATNGNVTPPELSVLPGNYPSVSSGRADTTLRNPSGTYPLTDSMNNPITHTYAYFQNQSDTLPQTITPMSSPAHPILQNGGQSVTVYPDHMHEGTTWGTVSGFDYVHQLSPYGDTTKAEFRSVAGDHPTPQVIATGQTRAQGSYYVGNDSPATHMAPIAIAGDTVSGTPPVNTLAIYDGRSAGVGRIVTGSTFHHYLDINLIGTSYVTDSTINGYVGGNAGPGQGLSANPQVFAEITAVYVNITNWLARPKPSISLILERSTFGQSEVAAMPMYPAAVLVTVDGLKPSQFPSGGITTLTPTLAQLLQWAPAVVVAGVPITLTPTAVASDDPSFGDRLQRLTFTYELDFTGDAFVGGAVNTVSINASLATTAAPNPLTDQAWLELVKSANPFMLDLADNNTTSWLSSDIKAFHVVAGDSFLGHTLPANATRTQALAYLQNVVSGMDTTAFTNLDPSEEGSTSVLSVAAVTTSNKPVFNFALARVRISSAGGDANPVQLFFRTFVTQTTAALTYQLDASQNPTGGYQQTSGTSPVPLPGTQAGGSQWLSFPFFASTRAATPAGQTDPKNSKAVLASAGFQFYGALIDNNLDDPYLTETPVSGGAAQSLPTILMGEHQCIVTEVIYSGSPIPSGANPATSDKIAQRNLAISTVANPGLSASRVAMHTFEIEATPGAITPDLPPDELLLAWPRAVPRGTYVSLHLPGWNAQEVVALADRLYARHDIRATDAHTIEIPGGGDRYVPIPRSPLRQPGVVSVALPLGIRKGQRFDIWIQQLTNRQRRVKQPEPAVEQITLEQAAELLRGTRAGAGKRQKDIASAGGVERGVFDLGNGRSLVTDLSVFDGGGDHALIVTHPDPKKAEAARNNSRVWREPIGTFQLGIPVSTREDMLLYHLQLLSIMLWRFEHLDRKSIWHPSMTYYLELLIEKVLALGGDPYAVPPTPGGSIPQLDGGNGHGHGRPGEWDVDCRDQGERCEDKQTLVTVNIFPRGEPRKDHRRR